MILSETLTREPPAHEQSCEENEKPEAPGGVGFVDGFEVGGFGLGQLAEGGCICQIGFAGIGEMGGGGEEAGVALFDGEEAGLEWCAEESRLSERDGLRRGVVAFEDQIGRSGFCFVRDDESLTEIEVRGLGRDLGEADAFEEAMQQDGDGGEFARVAADEIEMTEKLEFVLRGGAETDERSLALPEQDTVLRRGGDFDAFAHEEALPVQAVGEHV